MKTILLRLLLMFLALSFASCRRISVSDLVADPDRYADQKYIIVCGRVVQSVNVFFARGYILEDKGDQLLVLTDKSVPQAGEDDCVMGTFSQAVKVPGFELFVLDARK